MRILESTISNLSVFMIILSWIGFMKLCLWIQFKKNEQELNEQVNRCKKMVNLLREIEK